MKKALAGIAAALAISVAPMVLPAPPAEAKTKIDCSMLLFKPQHFLQTGNWSPRHLPRGFTVAEWLDVCTGRIKVIKKSPDRGPGHWPVTVHLNVKNCTYRADQPIKDWGWWKQARITVAYS